MSASKSMGLVVTTGVFGVAVMARYLGTSRSGGRRRDDVGSSGGEFRVRPGQHRQLEIRGLRNVGNSCFINAVLQSLASLPPFREYLEALSPSTSPIRAQQIPFTVELLKLMNDLRPEVPTPTFPYPRTLSPHKLRTLLRDRVDRFGKDDQQDAQELFQMVMRLIGEEAALCLKNREKDSFLGPVETHGAGGLADLMDPEKGSDAGDDRPKNPLSGSLAYVRRCTVCDSVSTRMERFVDLSLTLPEARDHVAYPMRRSRPVDLATILKDFTSQQQVEDVECATCAIRSAIAMHEPTSATEEEEEEEDGVDVPPKRVRANMCMLLCEPPKTLCLHFPRRHQCPSGLEMKLEQRVNFPLHLDVTPFCFTGGHHTDSIGLPAALQPHAALASSLRQLPGRVAKAQLAVGPGMPTEAMPLPSPSPAHSPSIAKALQQSPQSRPCVKQTLVGGSVERASAGASDGGRKELGGLPNGGPRAMDGGGTNGSTRGRGSTDENDSRKEGVEYDLRAVIVHQGSADSGHYTAFRKLESGPEAREGGEDGQEDWVDISDETVNRVSQRAVLASQAYMLFYRRRREGLYGQGLG